MSDAEQLSIVMMYFGLYILMMFVFVFVVVTIIEYHEPGQKDRALFWQADLPLITAYSLLWPIITIMVVFKYTIGKGFIYSAAKIGSFLRKESK